MDEAIIKSELRVLMLEDTPTDAELAEHELRTAGIVFTSKRVETREAFIKALAEFRPDIVLSDYKLPDFDGMAALKIVRRDYPEVPVIMVTGALVDIEAVEMIHAGAKDYVLKDRLARLGSAVQHALSMEQGIRARKQAEKALRDSEARYKRITEGLTDYQYTVRIENGRVVETTQSPACERVTGYSAEEFAADPSLWIHMVVPEDRESVMERVRQILAGMDVPPMEHQIIRKDGEIRWVSDTTILFKDASGVLLSYDGVIKDITERMKAAQLIKESEDRYHQLFENISSGVAIYQPDAACETFTFKSVNRAVERIEQLRRDELLGRNVEDVFPGMRPFGLLEVFQRVCHSGKAEHFPPVFYQDERIAGWRDNYVYRLASGEIVTVYDDVTERVEHEAQINNLNRTLRVLSNCNSALIHATTEEELFQNVCQNIVETGGYLLAWVSYPGTGADGIPVPFAHVGNETLYQRHAELDHDPVHQRECMTIAALRERKTKVCNNLYESLECNLGVLHKAGVAAVCALPLLCNNEAYGVLTIFASSPDAFGAAEIKLAEELAADLAYGIVTLRARAEHEHIARDLHESDKRYRAAMEMARDAIITIDGGNGVITAWNHAAETIFGYSEEEVIGRDLHEILPPPRFREAAMKGMAHFATTGEGALINKTLELVALHKNGTEFPIELSLSAMQIDSKWYATGIVRDITERKAAEAGLKLFRALVDHSHDAIEVNDPATHRFIDVNETACRTLGYSRDELLSMRIQDIDPGMGDLGMKKIGEDLQAHGSAIIETRHRRKDGSYFPVEVSITSVRLDRVYGVSMVRDITERKRSEEALLRLNRTLKALSAGNHALVHAENETELLENMCRATAEGGYVLAWVGYALQDEKKSIVPMAIFGEGKAYVEALTLTWDDLPLGRGPTGTAVRSGQTQIANNIGSNPGMEPWREAAAKYGYASSIALPLKKDGQVLGVLTIYAAEPEAFSADQVVLLEEMASDLTYGIVTLRIRSDHEQHATILRQSLEQSIQTIASTVEARDPYTAGHQRRVSELATAIALEIGLPEEQINGIHLAAIIHDLGKIHIPAEILSKPGKLTDIEFMLIKTHSQAGYDILKNVKFPWPIADIVLQHHEKLDGSGYPQGLKGEQILLESKIMTVADVVEAMSSHRPYRPTLGIEIALGEIKRGRGKEYDPAIVDVCLKLFAEKRFSFSN